MVERSVAIQPKRLALFLDGTWNQVADNTNIWRLRSLIASTATDGREQRAYYSTGLGTKYGEKIRGGMFGFGIDTAITSAYEWLVENYEDGDEIFLFGFSRGAYTARSLSGFVSKSGLLLRGAPLGVNQLYKRYRRKGARTIRELIAAHHDDPGAVLDREEQWMLDYVRAVPVKFIGVFDTVGALGVPFPILRELTGSAHPFLNTGLRQNNEFAFHALAIDEHRKDFRPTLWSNQAAATAPRRPIDRTEQRWFAGAHANVGGGCFNDPLAQLPLKWLEQKAIGCGLCYDDPYSVAGDPAQAKVSDSFTEFMWGFYRILRLGIRYYRPIGEPPVDEGAHVENINETIDRSVFERWRQNAGYRPPSLVKWADRRAVDPATLSTFVLATDPKVSVAD